MKMKDISEFGAFLFLLAMGFGGGLLVGINQDECECSRVKPIPQQEACIGCEPVDKHCTDG